MPRSRRTALTALVAALAGGEIDLSAGGDWEAARARLSALPGFGPWTVETIAMRALGDPDAFVPGDLAVRQAAERLGLPTRPAALTARAESWRPWRAYVVQYLCATGDHPATRLPEGDTGVSTEERRRGGGTARPAGARGAVSVA